MAVPIADIIPLAISFLVSFITESLGMLTVDGDIVGKTYTSRTRSFDILDKKHIRAVYVADHRPANLEPAIHSYEGLDLAKGKGRQRRGLETHDFARQTEHWGRCGIDEMWVFCKTLPSRSRPSHNK